MAHLIKQEQDKHLKFVLDQSEEGKQIFLFSKIHDIKSSFPFPAVLIEFCKLAIEYVSNGINEKKCSVAASKYLNDIESTDPHLVTPDLSLQKS